MFHTVLATVGLVACLLLAVEMVLPARTRRAWRQRLGGLRGRLQGGLGRNLGWRLNPRARRRVAHDETQAAISRARERAARTVRRDGAAAPLRSVRPDDEQPPTLH